MSVRIGALYTVNDTLSRTVIARSSADTDIAQTNGIETEIAVGMTTPPEIEMEIAVPVVSVTDERMHASGII